MSEVLADRRAQTARAFDSVAATYDGPQGNNAVVRWMRERLWRAVEAKLPPSARLLDLGSGTGLDAAHFAARGHAVVAIDSSPAMVRRTAERAARTGLADRITALEIGIHELEKLEGERFDGVYSDLGALNCAPDLKSVAARCAAMLPAGAPLVASVIGRICPWEIASHLARLHPGRAFVRFSKDEQPVGLNGGTVWTSYYRPAEFAAAFAKAFDVDSWNALGLFLPPPYLVTSPARLPRVARPLGWLDDHLGRAPLLRDAGDHFLVVLRRRG